MNNTEFITLCTVNNIDTDNIVVGYTTYKISTNKTTFDYQSFIFYNMTTQQYQRYNIDNNDIKKYVKNQVVKDVKLIDSTLFVDIQTHRKILWLYPLDDKYIIKDIDLFLKYNGMDNKK